MKRGRGRGRKPSEAVRKEEEEEEKESLPEITEEDPPAPTKKLKIS
jgi:hypothetical protein